jgi:hypothetical protein
MQMGSLAAGRSGLACLDTLADFIAENNPEGGPERPAVEGQVLPGGQAGQWGQWGAGGAVRGVRAAGHAPPMLNIDRLAHLIKGEQRKRDRG